LPFSLAESTGLTLPHVHVVDIGASLVEGADHYAPLLARGLARVTGFEPDPEQYQALLASGRPGYRYLPYAVGTGGPATFHVARFPGCSSLFPPDRAFLDAFTAVGASLPAGNFAITHTVPVDTVRLDDVGELGAVDYVKLDIQGAERDALRHARTLLQRVLVIESEVLFAPLYEGQGDFADLTALLRDAGFQLLEVRDVHRCSVAPFLHGRTAFAPRGQWMWGDAVYVRRWWDLQGWSQEDLLKAATILHEVYEVYDLVHHLLVEMQLRSGEPVADRYRAAMARDPALAAQWPVVRDAWSKVLTPERVGRAGALAG
jgi:FkbM family methyltransferase